MKKWFILLAVFVVIGLGVVYSTAKTATKVLAPQPDIQETTVYKLVNDERTRVGVTKLVYDETLELGAQMRSDELCNIPMSHDNFVPTALEVKYHAKLIGENLAKDWYSDEEMVTGWINSPTHYENIKNPAFVETGIGVADCGETVVVTQWFGTGN